MTVLSVLVIEKLFCTFQVLILLFASIPLGPSHPELSSPDSEVMSLFFDVHIVLERNPWSANDPESRSRVVHLVNYPEIGILQVAVFLERHHVIWNDLFLADHLLISICFSRVVAVLDHHHGIYMCHTVVGADDPVQTLHDLQVFYPVICLHVVVFYLNFRA